MKKLIGCLMLLFAVSPVARALYPVYSGVAVSTSGASVSETALAYSTKTYTFDMYEGGADVVSLQLNISTKTFTSKTFTDGSVSTGSITVVSTTPIKGVQGSNTIVVASTNGLTGAIINVNGSSVTNSGWRVDKASNTAIDMATQLSTVTGFTASTTTTTTVTIKCSAYGIFCNDYTLSVSTPALTVGAAKFSGGINHSIVTINGVSGVEGTDFIVTTASGTAKSISDWVMGNTSLNTIIQSTWTAGGVVRTTSTAVGLTTKYSIATSTVALLTSGVTMTGGTDASFTANSPLIAIASHGLTLGVPVLFSTGAVAIGGLTNQTTYYVFPVDSNTIALASSKANAVNGSTITLTSSGTYSSAHTYTLAPLAITGAGGFYLTASNDGVNWTSVTTGNYNAAISSITFSTPYAATYKLWDLGQVNHRYLRFNASGPSTGGVVLDLYMNRKSNKAY